ncbi:CDP-glycerol:glycerophosphate glycerophosphotransferase [Methanosphaera sp.]
MVNLFNFSIIIPFKNTEQYLTHTIDSVIEQTLDFKENIQIILLNVNSTDNSNYIAQDYQKKYPLNITYIESNLDNKTEAINQALNSTIGSYIGVIDSTDYITKDTLKNVLTFFNNNENIDIVTIQKKGYDYKSAEYPNQSYTNTKVIDLNKKPNNPLTSIYATFFKRTTIKLENTVNKYSQDILTLNKILLNNKQYGITSGCYYQNDYEKRLSTRILTQNKEYYTNRLNNIHKKLIEYSLESEKEVPKFIQYTIIHDLQDLLNITQLETLTTKEEISIFWKTLNEIISYIDIEVIAQNSRLTSEIRSIYLKLFYDSKIELTNNNALLKTGEHIIDSLNNHKINLYSIHENDGKIHFSGNLTSCFNLDSTSIKIINENTNEEIPCHFVEYPINNYNYQTILSKTWRYAYTFETELPITEIKSKYSFQVTYKNNNETINYNSKIELKISPSSENKGTLLVNNRILYNDENTLIIAPYEKQETKFEFSIILPVHNNKKYINTTIDSIINQTLSFKENTQLIIIDMNSTDKTTEIIQTYYEQYPDNIKLLHVKTNNPVNARNLGLKYANGKYVNFIEEKDYLSEDTLLNVKKLFEKYPGRFDVTSIPIYSYKTDAETGELDLKKDDLNYKFNYDHFINLNKVSYNIQMAVKSTFIRFSAIRELEFNKDLVASWDSLFINKILLKEKLMGVLSPESAKYYQFNETKSGVIDVTEDKKYYTHRLINFHKSLINYCMNLEGKIPSFIQYTLAYDINNLLKIPDLDVFDSELEKEEFWYYLHDIIGYIGNNAILKNKGIKGPTKSFFMYLRKGTSHIEWKNNIISLKSEKYTIDKLNSHKLWFDIVDMRDGLFVMSGHMVSNFNNDYISIKLIQTGNGVRNEYDCEYFEYAQEERRTKRFLGYDWQYDYNFNVRIPLESIDGSKLTFKVTFKNKEIHAEYEPKIGFRLFSGLSEISLYYVKENHIVFYDDYSVYVNAYKYRSMVKFEARNIKAINSKKVDGFRYMVLMRLIHLLLFPFMKNKRIWFINDRINRADDNGKHLFKYAIQQDDGITKYFIIDKNCDDYEVMKKIDKHVIPHGSFKHKILYMFAEKRIASYINESYFNPFWNDRYDYRKLYCNMIVSPRYFLQHGVISKDLTNHIKRYKYNLALIVTSADIERESFFELDYGFPENVVRALGLPRYDNLTKDDTKKQILFAPTWRSNLEDDEELFIQSDYYEMINSFLNNEKLKNLLKEHGYKLILKPHPQLEKHLDSFNFPDDVIISTKESYQDLFGASAILISDYSSVIFDFSYLEKPVIHYQANDDYHFGEANFDYETMGFGDVIKSEDDLIDKIKYYLENNCEMEDKYKERVNSFFKYHDKNNCKRVYEWIYNH